MGHTPQISEGPSKEFRYVQMLVNVDCKSSYININIIEVKKVKEFQLNHEVFRRILQRELKFHFHFPQRGLNCTQISVKDF